jgi:gentisate 1,2-dioxygenase
VATSQTFYVIRGSGETSGEHGTFKWFEGDYFALPKTEKYLFFDFGIL